MRSIPKPAVNVSEHFTRCSIATKDVALRARLLASEPTVLNDTAIYDAAGNASTFFLLANSAPSAATDDELRGLYKRSMARIGSAGRHAYDLLKHSAPAGICPLCGQRPATTLDHYLPKELYPKLAIAPINLIPCCSDCNRIKHSFVPANADEQLFHPYFDNNNNEQWLHADVIYAGLTPAIRFHASPPNNWAPVRSRRIINHFTKLELSQLYSIYGTNEISIVRASIERILLQGGPADVQAHLRESWMDRHAIDPNSWQSATYFALHTSPHICAGHLGPPP